MDPSPTRKLPNFPTHNHDSAVELMCIQLENINFECTKRHGQPEWGTPDQAVLQQALKLVQEQVLEKVVRKILRHTIISMHYLTIHVALFLLY